MPNKKGAAGRVIDEDIQEPMRRRLELLRRSKHMLRTQFRTLTEGTMVRYERKDISTFKLGDLFGLATEFGLDPLEFFRYLVGDQDLAVMTRNENRNIDTVSVYMRQLPPDVQELCVMVIRSVVDHYDLDQRGALAVENPIIHKNRRRPPGEAREVLAAVMAAAKEA